MIYQNKIRFLKNKLKKITSIIIYQTTKSYIIILKIIHAFYLSVPIFVNQLLANISIYVYVWIHIFMRNLYCTNIESIYSYL